MGGLSNDIRKIILKVLSSEQSIYGGPTQFNIHNIRVEKKHNSYDQLLVTLAIDHKGIH